MKVQARLICTAQKLCVPQIVDSALLSSPLYEIPIIADKSVQALGTTSMHCLALSMNMGNVEC